MEGWPSAAEALAARSYFTHKGRPDEKRRFEGPKTQTYSYGADVFTLRPHLSPLRQGDSERRNPRWKTGREV